MCKEVVAVGVEQRGFDVVVQIFEQEVITALDEVESVGYFPAIDGVVACVKHDVLRIGVGVNNVARGAAGDQHFLEVVTNQKVPLASAKNLIDMSNKYFQFKRVRQSLLSI